MQIFPCPFCGPRDESEFHYVGEPRARPEPAGAVSDAEWADYLCFNANPKGQAREIWLHLACMEMFAMTRDTATNIVIGSEALAGTAALPALVCPPTARPIAGGPSPSPSTADLTSASLATALPRLCWRTASASSAAASNITAH